VTLEDLQVITEYEYVIIITRHLDFVVGKNDYYFLFI